MKRRTLAVYRCPFPMCGQVAVLKPNRKIAPICGGLNKCAPGVQQFTSISALDRHPARRMERATVEAPLFP